MDADNRLLPVFPLPVVQFPGAVTPLHIFEPRYRKMLKDVTESTRTFGIVYRRDDSQMDATTPRGHKVGCSVEIVAVDELPDGRSNIACLGVRRFRVLGYVEGEPYLQAEVAFFDDEPPTRDLSEEVDRASRLLWRVIVLGRRIGEVPGMADENDEAPQFPSDPQLFSTMLCSYLAIDLEEKQALLELIDSAERLDRANRILEGLLIEYERRALAQDLSKKNGYAGSISQLE